KPGETVPAVIVGVDRIPGVDQFLGQPLVSRRVLTESVGDLDYRARLARLPHVIVDCHAMGVLVRLVLACRRERDHLASLSTQCIAASWRDPSGYSLAWLICYA